jgi:signal transduction histidine kinase
MGAGGVRDLRRYAPGKPFALAIAAVVAGFAGSLVLSHVSARSIDGEVSGIVDDAAPCIITLTRARRELRRLATYPNLYLAWRGAGTTAARARMGEARDALARDLFLYDSAPRPQGDAALIQGLREEMGSLFALVDRITDRMDDDQVAATRVLWIRDMLPVVEQLDHEMELLVEHNARYASAHAQEIGRVRHQAVMTAVGLGVMSVLLAAAAAFLAFETMRRHGRLMSDHNLLVEARADELEQFSSRVAHDIKSPLGAVGLALHLANRGQADPSRIKAVTARALSSLRRVQQIVDGLLAFAKAGARPGQGDAASLGEVVDQVIDELRPLADDEHVTITVERPERLWVAFAPGSLASVVSNLIRNAIKFTAGSAERRVEVRAIDHGLTARLEVEDTGRGVPPHLQALIFEPYVRAPGAASAPGIGLGLATVKRLTEAHGGSVGVRSAVGEGSCFWCDLPKVDPRPLPDLGPAVSDAASPQQAG